MSVFLFYTAELGGRVSAIRVHWSISRYQFRQRYRVTWKDDPCMHSDVWKMCTHLPLFNLNEEEKQLRAWRTWRRNCSQLLLLAVTCSSYCQFSWIWPICAMWPPFARVCDEVNDRPIHAGRNPIRRCQACFLECWWMNHPYFTNSYSWGYQTIWGYR